MRPDWLLSATALLLAVLAVRWAFGARISARLRYALWLLAALRLLVPLSFGESALSPANLLHAQEAAPARTADAPAAPAADGAALSSAGPAAAGAAAGGDAGSAEPRPGGAAFGNDAADSSSGGSLRTRVLSALPTVWLAGMGTLAAWFAACNLFFSGGFAGRAAGSAARAARQSIRPMCRRRACSGCCARPSM